MSVEMWGECVAPLVALTKLEVNPWIKAAAAGDAAGSAGSPLSGWGGGLETKEGEKGGWPVLLGLTKLAVNSGSRQQWQEALLLLLQQEQQINARFCKVPGTVPGLFLCVYRAWCRAWYNAWALVCVVCVYEGVCFGLVDLAAATGHQGPAVE
jgi:hypothetical protein